MTSVRLINLKIQCYMCHKMGHYKSECPRTHKLEESHLVVDIIDRAGEIPIRQEQKEAFLRATQNPVILEETSKTFVSQALVDQVSMTNKKVEVKIINPGHEIYQVACVNIEVAGYKTDLEVCIHSDLSYNVLLVRDFYFLWEVEFCEVNLAVCHVMKTKQQQRKEIEENQTNIAKFEIQ